MCVCVFVCVSKRLPGHFRQILSNLDPNTCFLPSFVLPAEKPAFADVPGCTYSQIFYQNTAPNTPNGKSVQRTAFC